MNIRLDKRYLKVIFYIALGSLIIFLLFYLVFNFNTVAITIIGGFKGLLKILKPFIWGLILAYLLMPIAIRIEELLDQINQSFSQKTKKTKMAAKQKNIKINHPIRRTTSVVLGILFLLMLFFGSIYGLFLMVEITSSDFINNKSMITKNVVREVEAFINTLENGLNSIGVETDIKTEIIKWFESLKLELIKLLGYLPSTITQVVFSFVNLFFAFIFAANLVISREYFYTLLNNLLDIFFSKKWIKTMKDIGHEMDKVIKKFIIGYALDLTLISIVTSVALWVAGFPYPFFVGIFAGYTNIIPYIGSWVGALPIILVTILDGGLKRGIFGYVYILIIQQLYYSTVSPKIQGDYVGIHPLFVLLSFIVFGNLFGIIGMILAVPLAGIIRVFIVQFHNHWKVKRDIPISTNDKKKY